eukprot:symbB.v1.2.008730.t1/scaffold542.1/size189608/3
MAGPEAAEALCRSAPAIRSALLAQEQQNCRDEDPVLGRYIPGSWMHTCVYLLSGGTAVRLPRKSHSPSHAQRLPLGFEKVQIAADTLSRGEQLGGKVDVRHAKDAAGPTLTVTEFRRCFEASKPLILKEADRLSSSHPTGWSLDALHRSVNKRLCRCHVQDDALALTSGRTKLSVIRLPFDEYVTYMESHQDIEPLYLFQELEPDLKQAIDPSFHPPEIFKEDFLLDAYEPPEGFTGLAGWLLVGPPSSGSRWHFDPWSTAAWNLLFEGKKLWAFFPPSELGQAAPPKVEAQLLGGLAAEARRFYAAPPVLTLADVLGTVGGAGVGDLIFIPSGWWHCTVSLTKTSAYTRNYINSHNYARAEEALAKLHPYMAKQLRTWIWKLHMDDSEDEERAEEPVAKKPRKKSEIDSAMRRRQSFILLLAISAWALGFNQNHGWCGPSRRNLVVRHAKDEIAKRLGRVSTPRRRETVESEQEGFLSGAVGGAVLGGLLLGPFGAIFGANLGSEWGAKRAPRTEEEEMDEDIVQLARSTGRELADAMEGKARVLEAKDTLAAKIIRLEDEIQDLTKRAEAALEAEDEATARAFLEKRYPLQKSLESGKSDLEDALRRVATVESNVQQLEDQALKVSSLLERARDATGAQRTALKAEASAFSVKDPLLDRFDRL